MRYQEHGLRPHKAGSHDRYTYCKCGMKLVTPTALERHIRMVGIGK